MAAKRRVPMNNEEKKVVNWEVTETSTYVDVNTGEVISQKEKKHQKARLPKEPPFVKVYLNLLSRFKDIQVSFNPILIELLKSTSFAHSYEELGGMILFLNKPLKNIIAKKCGVSLSRVDHAVTEFVKKGYMRRIELGMYQFNPYLFGIGEWKDILNIRATFDCGTGEVIAEIVKTEEQAMNIATEQIEQQSEKTLNELNKN